MRRGGGGGSKAARSGVATLALVLSLAAGQAQGAKVYADRAAPPPSGVTFGAVLDLKQEGGELAPMLRSGRVADSATWPASFYLRYDVGAKPYVCSAALVGPEVLLTAAHCVPDNGKIKVQLGPGPPVDGDCERHPGWGQDYSADFALCDLAAPVREPRGFYYETVDARPVASLLNGRVLLGGYGCTDDDVATSRREIDRRLEGERRAREAAAASPPAVYRIGFSRLAESSASPPKREREQFYEPHEHFNLITAPDGANVCPGDSGGPAFVLNPTAATAYNKRALVAVNSRVLFADPDLEERYGASLLSAVGAPGKPGDSDRKSFTDWALEWAGRRHVQICGVTQVQPPNCREV